MNFLAHVSGTPRYIILFVSDKCWMNCSHCWFHDEWKSTHHRNRRLSFNEMKKLAQSIRSVNFLSLTGGEAFLRDDIVELVGMFCRTTKVRHFDIPTSGYESEMIHLKVRDILKRNPDVPFRVGISLDGPREIHELIRGVKGGFERTLKTIELLRQIRKENQMFDMGIITTVSKDNEAFVVETAELVEDICPEVEWQVNFVRGNPRDPYAANVSTSSYKQANDLINSRIARGKYGGHGSGETGRWLSAKNAARRRIILEHMEKEQPALRCAAGALGGVIYIDGETMPCELMDVSMGNLRDFDCDLHRLWQSEAASNVRKQIYSSRCFCSQECFLTVSMIANPSKWPMILRERIRLIRSKRHLE